MKKLLIKLSGEVLNNTEIIKSAVAQIKQLRKNYKIGLVIGGGNIFRGSQHSKNFGIKATTGHSCGMIATLINGLILKDLFEKEDVESTVLSAVPCSTQVKEITQERINKSLQKNKLIIFVGGTGNPFFTTDTNSCLRALQMGAEEIWKCTKVDGVFEQDPNKEKDTPIIKKISYQEYIQKKLKVMDLCAITLAEEHSIKIRVFNIFKKDSLLVAEKDKTFGSIIN